MNANTMEGLIGAKTNVNLLNTPMHIFNEAERRGDTATMERAMGYAVELADKAEEYKTKTSRGMEEDARETKEKAKLEREEAVQKRKEEHEKLEAKIEDNKSEVINTDTVKISEEGREFVKDSVDLNTVNVDKTKADAARESITYTKTGEMNFTEQSAEISVFV